MRSITTMTTHKKHNSVATDTNNLNLTDVEIAMVLDVLSFSFKERDLHSMKYSHHVYSEESIAVLDGVFDKLNKTLNHMNTKSKDD